MGTAMDPKEFLNKRDKAIWKATLAVVSLGVWSSSRLDGCSELLPPSLSN